MVNLDDFEMNKRLPHRNLQQIADSYSFFTYNDLNSFLFFERKETEKPRTPLFYIFPIIREMAFFRVWFKLAFFLQMILYIILHCIFS